MHYATIFSSNLVRQKHKHYSSVLVVFSQKTLFFKGNNDIFFYDEMKTNSPNSENNFKCYHDKANWRLRRDLQTAILR